MYILKNIFGMIRVFSDLPSAEDAYFEEVAFCEYAELKNAHTGEVIRTSY